MMPKPRRLIVIIVLICVCTYYTTKEMATVRMEGSSIFRISNLQQPSNSLIRTKNNILNIEDKFLVHRHQYKNAKISLNITADNVIYQSYVKELDIQSNRFNATNEKGKHEKSNDFELSANHSVYANPSNKTNGADKLETSPQNKDYVPKTTQRQQHNNLGRNITLEHSGIIRDLPEWVGSRRPVFSQRAGMVEETCQKYKNTKEGNEAESVKLENIRLARSASTLTCLINKVASSSVADGLVRSEGLKVQDDDKDGSHQDHNEEHSIHSTAAALIPQNSGELEFAANHFFKFLLVRDPFVRLLSAYRDKVERAKHWSLQQLRHHILSTLAERHLGQGSNKQVIRSNKQVIRSNKQVIRSNNNNNKPLKQDTASDTNGMGKKERKLPTFSDFLEYVLLINATGNGFDSHWTPYWRLCSPCSLHYNVIAKLETAHLDLKPIWWRLGLGTSDVPWYNPSSREHQPSNHAEKDNQPTPITFNNSPQTHDNNPPHINTNFQDSSPIKNNLQNLNSSNTLQPKDVSLNTTLQHYFMELKPDLIARVYRHFALDFQLFGYDILDVFRLGGHCHTYECLNVMHLIT